MQIPTNPMYDIDDNGVVRLISNNKIIEEYVNHHGKRAVKIRGKSHKLASNPLDRLMLLTYKRLPANQDHQWLSVKFLDGNKDNIKVDNLEWDDTWYYPHPYISVEFGTTAWVPAYGYPQIELRIDKGHCVARYTTTHHEIGYYVDIGYQFIRFKGSKPNLRYHRLIALTFLPHPIDTDHLTINHKDSDTLNNDPRNLEWATYTQNNIHAFSEGPRGSTVRKIRVKNLATGEEALVAGYNEMGRHMGILPQAAHQVMERRNFEGRPYKGYVFKFEDDLRSWEELKHSGPRKDRIKPEKIARKNLDTGEVKIYNDFNLVLTCENIQDFSLFRLLKLKPLIPWRRRCFQAVVDNKPLIWPEYPKEIIDVYEQVHSSDRPIKVTALSGSVNYYTNITSWCNEDRENRCDPAVLCRYIKHCKENKLRWHDWVFEYIDLKDYLLK